MPKKRSAKDQARYYTIIQRTRIRPPEKSDQPKEVKDVTTRLHELRLQQDRGRTLSKSKSVMPETPSPPSSSIPPPPTTSLGFIPATSLNFALVNYPGCSTDSELPARPTRRIPGPPPPPSWLRRPAAHKLVRSAIAEVLRAKSEPFDRSFPDLDTPRQPSLVHATLCLLGTYFFEHQEVNKYYLPQLGIQLKQWLLSYIAAKNITGGITKAGLDVLFPHTVSPNDLEEMTEIVRLSKIDEADLTYLDLSGALQNLSLVQLRNFFSPPTPVQQTLSVSPSDDWEHMLPRFVNLTHLTLDISSYPKPGLSIDYLKLAQILSEHCTRLTHLSLAGIFTTNTSSVSGALLYLSKHLVCLEYIDLSRAPRISARINRPDLDKESSNRNEWVPLLHTLDWGGAWRNVRTLVIWRSGFTKKSADDARKCILEKRGGMPWIRIIGV